MTGLGAAARSNERHRFEVTLRSVNGRHLDLALRLREEHRVLEPELRRLLEGPVARGRLDATIEIRSLAPLPAVVELQAEVVRALHVVAHELAERGLVTGELTLGDLLRIPEVVMVRVAPDELDAEDRALLVATVEEALAQLVASRGQEGERLAAVLAGLCAELSRVVAALEERVGAVRAALHESLRRRIADLVAEVDEARLAQEAAFLVERSDVREELDRLAAHLAHFAEVAAADAPVGKRLDFLTQEILRELNTIGSKARDADTTRLVLDGKVVCERLREQVQNVE